MYLREKYEMGHEFDSSGQWQDLCRDSKHEVEPSVSTKAGIFFTNQTCPNLLKKYHDVR
jgi:hypothetical protein